MRSTPPPLDSTASAIDPAADPHTDGKSKALANGEKLPKQEKLTLPAEQANGPRIVIDSREKEALPCHLFLPVEVRGLPFGDYSVSSDGPEGLGMMLNFGIELKRIQDLVHCCVADRQRFELQLARLRAVHYGRLLILGHPSDIEAGNYRSGVSPRAILGTLSALEARHGIATVWISDPIEAARWICRAAHYFWRESAKAWRPVQPCEVAYTAPASTLQLPA